MKRLKKNSQEKIPAKNKLHSLANKIGERRVIPFEDLTMGDEIGSGAFGVIHVAFWKGDQVAVKKLRVKRVHEKRKKDFEAEVSTFYRLNHLNIVQFYGACVITPNLAIVMEFLGDGSLYDNIHLSHNQFRDSIKDQIIIDSFAALKYLHNENVLHRDIKSKNIMLFEKKTRCKLADFGLSLIKDESDENSSQKEHSAAGTRLYLPKEVLNGARLTIKELKFVDVYSLAVTMVELLTEGINFARIHQAIIDGNANSLDGYGIPENKQILLKGALSNEMANRPTAALFLEEFERIIVESTLNVD